MQIAKLEMTKGKQPLKQKTFLKIIRDYFAILFAYKFENLDEMNIFLGKQRLLKLTPFDLESLNRPVSIEEIDKVIEELPHKKTTGPDGFSEEFYQTFGTSQAQCSINYSRALKGEETFLTYYMKSIILIPKPNRQCKERKLQINITHVYCCRNTK